MSPHVLHESSSLPVLRPLRAWDKREGMAKAASLGILGLSELPADVALKVPPDDVEVETLTAALELLVSRGDVREAMGAAAAELGKTPPPEPVRLPANTSQQTRQKTNSNRRP